MSCATALRTGTSQGVSRGIWTSRSIRPGRPRRVLASIRLAAVCATALYSSDLLRAYETAQIIGQATGLQVVQKPGLRGDQFRCVAGLSSPQIRERDPDIYAARRANPYDVAPAGAETWRHFYDRAVRAVHDILAATEAQRVIVVTHSGSVRPSGCALWGLIAPASGRSIPITVGFIRLPCTEIPGVPWRLTISPISLQPFRDPYLRTRRCPMGTVSGACSWGWPACRSLERALSATKEVVPYVVCHCVRQHHC